MSMSGGGDRDFDAIQATANATARTSTPSPGRFPIPSWEPRLIGTSNATIPPRAGRRGPQFTPGPDPTGDSAHHLGANRGRKSDHTGNQNSHAVVSCAPTIGPGQDYAQPAPAAASAAITPTAPAPALL